MDPRRLAAPARAVPARLDARGRRRAARHHVDRLAADRGAGPRGRHARCSSPTAGGSGSPRPVAGWPSTRSRSSPRSTPPGSTSTRPPSRPAPCASPAFATAIRRSLLPVVARLATTHPDVHAADRTSTSRPRRSACSPPTTSTSRSTYDYNLGPGAVRPRRSRRRRCGPPRWGLGGPGRRTPAAPGNARRGRSPATATHDWIVNSRNTADEDVVRTLASLAGFAPRDRPPGRQPRPRART